MTMIELQDHARGEQVSARKLRRTNDAVRELQQGVRPPRQVIPAARPKAAVTGEPGAIRRFIYTGTMGADHLVCTDPLAEEPTQVLVAKPHELRRSTYHGLEVDGVLYTYPEDVSQSMTRVAKRMSDEYTENHHIRPFYTAGRPIIALGLLAEELGMRVGEMDVVWVDGDNTSRVWTRTR